MSYQKVSWVLWTVAWVVASGLARAQDAPRRQAFAVVIGNNHSLGARRPDLHYADDDAAKYYAILQTIAPGRVSLLADFDADTARMYPSLRAEARRPTRRALLEAGQQLAAAVREQPGDKDVYFVFAGHGDVDRGSGYIELSDGRFSAQDLERWLSAIPAARIHVILDSCNSFFMLGARKPGGRYYATPDDASRSLAARLPNVGVFLSTSAEGDAFEWSELQSGVFSHIVRSGLLGAADANGDAEVDYTELAAFVSTATADVVNPNMRPHVFARGPSGHDEAPIAFLNARSGARALQLSAASDTRYRLRDSSGVPLLDTHTEAGGAVQLALPEAWTEGATLESAGGGAEHPLQIAVLPPAPTELSLAALPLAEARGAARGPAEIFATLFTRPFGPAAVQHYLGQLKQDKPPVFGVSRESAERMRLLLDQIGSAEHDQRLMLGITTLGLTAYYGMLGASYWKLDRGLGNPDRRGADITAAAFGTCSLLTLGWSIFELASSWPAERMADEYRATLASGDYPRAFALANDRLQQLAAEERRGRWIRGIAGGFVVLFAVGTWANFESRAHTDRARIDARLYGGLGVLFGVSSLVAALLFESPTQRLLNLWSDDPTRVEVLPALAPISGGAMLGVNGRF